jgi:hypothetical protein
MLDYTLNVSCGRTAYVNIGASLICCHCQHTYHIASCFASHLQPYWSNCLLGLHYTTLHYTTQHYTTLHYTTLHYTTLHYTYLMFTRFSRRFVFKYPSLWGGGGIYTAYCLALFIQTFRRKVQPSNARSKFLRYLGTKKITARWKIRKSGVTFVLY